MDAMGGRDKLEKVTSLRKQTVSHTLLAEQSYRQAPFITSYERDQTTLDLAGGRMLTNAKLSWPENDLNQPEAESTLIVGPQGGVYQIGRAHV